MGFRGGEVPPTQKIFGIIVLKMWILERLLSKYCTLTKCKSLTTLQVYIIIVISFQGTTMQAWIQGSVFEDCYHHCRDVLTITVVDISYALFLFDCAVPSTPRTRLTLEIWSQDV